MRIFHASFALGVALIVGLSGSILLAQDQPAAGAPPPAATSPAPPEATSPTPPANVQSTHAPDPQRQARRMAKRLGLTPEQQSEIEPILEDRQQQIQSVRADTTLAPGDRRAKIRGIVRESVRKINAVLSDAQRRQYKQMRQEQRAKRLQREQQRHSEAPPPADIQ